MIQVGDRVVVSEDGIPVYGTVTDISSVDGEYHVTVQNGKRRSVTVRVTEEWLNQDHLTLF